MSEKNNNYFNIWYSPSSRCYVISDCDFNFEYEIKHQNAIYKMFHSGSLIIAKNSVGETIKIRVVSIDNLHLFNNDKLDVGFYGSYVFDTPEVLI